MSFACLEGNYDVVVPYRTSKTIRGLINRIQEGDNPESFVDTRLTDAHFPQTIEGDRMRSISLVSFNPGWSSKEDGLDFLKRRGHVPADAAELLALRAQYPSDFRYMHVVALASVWRDERGYPYAPCLNNGNEPGLRMRITTGGWVSFWKFAVKKTESE